MIKKLLRYIRFHLIFKRKFSKSQGIPTLCNNINHPYHESKFEEATCEALGEFFSKNEVLTPFNHKYSIKFDFIIKGIGIIEPHGIWSNSPGNNSYFDYYKQRREYADKEKQLKDLPLVVLSNRSDLNYLKGLLKDSNNYKKTFFEVSKELLEKNELKIPVQTQEFSIQVVNKFLLILFVCSLIINVFLLISNIK